MVGVQRVRGSGCDAAATAAATATATAAATAAVTIKNPRTVAGANGAYV